MARVLIACEFSGVVRRAFAMRGHDAWSCDLLPSEDRSNKHIIGDARDILGGNATVHQAVQERPTLAARAAARQDA